MQAAAQFDEIYHPSKPTRRQRPKAVGGASERSERGRSALFKNPLFFSGKFLGCYIETAQNFIRYVTIFVPDWGQKKHLAKLVLKSSVLKQCLPNSQCKLL